MTKPLTTSDLAEHELTPHEFFKADAQHLMRDIAVGHAFLTLLEALRASAEFDLSEELGDIKATLPLTVDERAEKLRRAQESWDTNQRWYQEAGEKRIESWKRYTIDTWAKREALEPIDWEKHDAIHAIDEGVAK